MTDVLVLDACAVLAYMLGEPGADEVERLLVEARSAGDRHLMTPVNWGEVLYVSARESKHEDVLPTVAAFGELPIAVVDSGRALALEAAHLKHVYRIGSADAFAAALSISTGAPLLTKDSGFEALESEGLQLRFLS